MVPLSRQSPSSGATTAVAAPPLPGCEPLRTVLRSRDFDDWRTSLRTLLGEHHSTLLSSRSEQHEDLGFQAHLRAGQVADIGIVAIEGVGRTRLDRHQGAKSYVLWLPLQGWVRETVNGDEVLAEPGMAMLCHPGVHMRGDSSARLRGLSLVLPAERLSALGFGSGTTAGRLPMLIGLGPAARIVINQAQRLADLVAGTARGSGALQADEEVQRLCETLLDWEAAFAMRDDDSQPASRSAAIVAEGEAWLAAHLHQPLRLADLARQLELTPRSLQLAFQRERGCSPMQRLKRLRLVALHGLLARPELSSLALEPLLASVGLPGYGRTRSEFRAWCGSSPQELRHQVLAEAALGPHLRSRIGSTRVTSE